MSGLLLKGINKVYPSGVQAVFNFCLDIRDKEFIVLVGPSGCGKSTTLRMIAGLEEISSGELYIDGKLVNDVVPKDRDIAMVFQNYALYPHMSVYDNMAFGLKLRKVPKEIIDQKVKAAAEILGITDYLSRKPKALSGGQRQRVALGRTIVREPKVFLLDEPLSNLDAKLRASMRTEISKLHARLATTFIYVTHDQIEAMTMGTRIVVMKDGFMQQVDTPQNLYDYPVNLFVASFIGTPQMNFFKESTLTSENGKIYVNFVGGNKILLPKSVAARIKNVNEYLDTGKLVTLGVRPEDIHQDQMFISNSPDTVVKARIEVIEKLGAETQIYCELDYEDKESSVIDNSTQMIAKISSRAVVEINTVVALAFDANHLHMFDGETEATMLDRDEGYEVIEKLGAETQIYCELDHEGKESSVIDNSTQMIAKISSRAVVALKDVVELAFDAQHIHMFDGETEASLLERDEGYEVIEENAEGSAFVPPTPQEMRERIDAARIVTKEMKAQARKDARMAKAAAKQAAATAAAAPVEEAPAEVEEAPVEEEKTEE